MIRHLFCLVSAALLLSSCAEGPYLKHDLKQEKLGSDCNSISRQFSLTANTVGDRFVYEACLDAAYSGNYSVERKGDTIVVLTQRSGGRTTPYRITLDINTYPEYHYLSLDGVVNQVHTSR